MINSMLLDPLQQLLLIQQVLVLQSTLDSRRLGPFNRHCLRGLIRVNL